MKPSNTHRLLVGIAVPSDAAREWIDSMAGDRLPDHEPADPAATWMTVHFIGDVPVRDVDDVAESIERSVSGVRPFTLTPRRITTLPTEPPVRQVVLGFDLPASLREIKDRLVRRLARGRKKGADEYQPRVTLARLKSPSEELTVDREVDGPLVPVEEVYLLRTVLLPDRYENRVVERLSM